MAHTQGMHDHGSLSIQGLQRPTISARLNSLLHNLQYFFGKVVVTGVLRLTLGMISAEEKERSVFVCWTPVTNSITGKFSNLKRISS